MKGQRAALDPVLAVMTAAAVATAVYLRALLPGGRLPGPPLSSLFPEGTVLERETPFPVPPLLLPRRPPLSMPRRTLCKPGNGGVE